MVIDDFHCVIGLKSSVRIFSNFKNKTLLQATISRMVIRFEECLISQYKFYQAPQTILEKAGFV